MLAPQPLNQRPTHRRRVTFKTPKSSPRSRPREESLPTTSAAAAALKCAGKDSLRSAATLTTRSSITAAVAKTPLPSRKAAAAAVATAATLVQTPTARLIVAPPELFAAARSGDTRLAKKLVTDILRAEHRQQRVTRTINRSASRNNDDGGGGGGGGGADDSTSRLVDFRVKREQQQPAAASGSSSGPEPVTTAKGKGDDTRGNAPNRNGVGASKVTARPQTSSIAGVKTEPKHHDLNANTNKSGRSDQISPGGGGICDDARRPRAVDLWGPGRLTPLHYAAEFGHSGVLRVLLWTALARTDRVDLSLIHI